MTVKEFYEFCVSRDVQNYELKVRDIDSFDWCFDVDKNELEFDDINHLVLV